MGYTNDKQVYIPPHHAPSTHPHTAINTRAAKIRRRKVGTGYVYGSHLGGYLTAMREAMRRGGD